jgi:hypothetical protein
MNHHIGLLTHKENGMNNIKVIENSLYWQQVVLKQSRNPHQIARVKKAIVKLEAQLSQLKGC